MTTRMPTLIPYYTVRDVQKAITFYEKTFGFHLEGEPAKDEKGNLQHAEMRFQDMLVMFCAEGAFGTQAKAPISSSAPFPLTLYVYCPNVDVFYENALKQQAPALEAPQDGFWGDRFCKVKDPDGYEWIFATPIPGHPARQ